MTAGARQKGAPASATRATVPAAAAAAAALPRENPKALAALAMLLQTTRTSAPESLRNLVSDANDNIEEATVEARHHLASIVRTTNLGIFWL